MQDLNAILDRQRTAFMAELPVPAAIRRGRLQRAIAMLKAHGKDFCDAMADDFGHRSRDQSMLTDIAASIGPLRHALSHVDRWMNPSRRSPMFPLGLLGAKAWVDYQPKGVVGIIAPWNFPVNLVMAPLAGVFAAGNRAMVKTSEYTPATAALFERIVLDFFAPDELAFVSGGVEVGEAFAALPFNHMLFTGATGVARHILRAAVENLVPVTLELGGKSPVVVGQGADLCQVAERVVLGKLLNAGQICLAPDYVLVPEGQAPALVEAMVQAASAMYPTIAANPDYTAIISDRHHARLTGLVDDARQRGARVTLVNPAGEDLTGTRKLPLAILDGATDAMAAMQEEIFGPVLPIISYRTADNAIARINRGGRPLALYYFGPDAGERRYVLDRTISGGVTLDDVFFHVAQEELPFGGIGPSGMGNYHGHAGFLTFAHARAVYRQSRFDVSKLAGLRPPYGKRLRQTIARQLK
jgi:coniferyl-aldehyde dehydrogenase